MGLYGHVRTFERKEPGVAMSNTPEESCSGKLQQWAKVMGYSGSMSEQDWKQLVMFLISALHYRNLFVL